MIILTEELKKLSKDKVYYVKWCYSWLAAYIVFERRRWRCLYVDKRSIDWCGTESDMLEDVINHQIGMLKPFPHLDIKILELSKEEYEQHKGKYIKENS